MTTSTELQERATELGREDGKARGSWVIDGNTTDETKRAIIQQYENGDPAVYELEPYPLSGEWADDPTPQTLADALGLAADARGSELDQLCTDYELGFSEGFWDEVIRSAQATL